MLTPRASSAFQDKLVVFACACLLMAGTHGGLYAQPADKMERAREAFAIGIGVFERGDYRRAAELFGEAVKLHELYPSAWYYLGRALLGENDLRGANRAFRKSVEQYPPSYSARMALAHTLLLLNRRYEAEKEARSVMGEAGSKANSNFVFGMVYLHCDEPAKALEEAELSLRRNDKFAYAYFLKCFALLSLHADRPQAHGVPPAPYAEAAQNLEKYLSLSQPKEADGFWREQLEVLRFYAAAANRGALQTPRRPATATHRPKSSAGHNPPTRRVRSRQVSAAAWCCAWCSNPEATLDTFWS